MKTFTVDLKELYPQLEPCAFKAMMHQDRPRAGVVVCPGGGYHSVSPREAEPVAEAFYDAGYNAYILTYATVDRFPDVHYPVQLQQAAASVLALRQFKERFASTGKVAVCGFSAGGHLAGSAAILYDRDCVVDFLKAPKHLTRPDAAVLCYPVVTATPHLHTGSMRNVTGQADPAAYRKLSLELYVSPETPPAFIWHTADDNAVPVQNALLLASAYAESRVPFALHVFHQGVHGLSLCDKRTWVNNPHMINPDAAQWFALCKKWLKKQFKP